MRVPDVEQRHAAEHEVAPFEGADNERTNQAANDKYPCHEHGGEDVGEGKTGGKEQLKEEQRQGDEPLDVTNILKIALGLNATPKKVEIHTQIWRVPAPPRWNCAVMGVAPRSDAMEKYDMVAVVRTMTAIWWNKRVPLALYIEY